MAKEGSVAPKERVNIVYKPATGNQREEVELPFKMLMIADFQGKADPRPVEERAPISVDKDNFGKVMAEHGLSVELQVPNRLDPKQGGELNVKLRIDGLADFTPDGISPQVPELENLLELRKALIALRGPMGNVPAFRRKLQSLLSDDGARAQLTKELGIGASESTPPSEQ